MLTFVKYQEGLAKGKLLGLFCTSCNVCIFPSQSICYKCGNRDLKIRELKKEGIIKTFTIVRITPDSLKIPFVVAMVKTLDDVYIMGNIINIDITKADMGLIGKKVKIDFETNFTSEKLHTNLAKLIFILL